MWPVQLLQAMPAVTMTGPGLRHALPTSWLTGAAVLALASSSYPPLRLCELLSHHDQHRAMPGAAALLRVGTTLNSLASPPAAPPAAALLLDAWPDCSLPHILVVAPTVC